MTGFLGYAGKRTIVTGCASGIGREVARLLTDCGAEVHGLDHRVTDLPLTSFSKVDLRYQPEINAALSSIAGPAFALFNCAGLPPMREPIDVITVNFIAARHISERLLARMPRGGAIASIGSNGGAGWPKRLATIRAFLETTSFDEAKTWCACHPEVLADTYRFSKEALAVWTMQWSGATIAQGVRLNCTSPGTVQTPMLDEIAGAVPATAIDAVSQPIGRRSSATEQAWPLLVLNSAISSYINGVDLPVDGGYFARRTLA